MKYFITFGQKYRREEHPAGGHPDGWFELEANNRAEARENVFAALDDKWSMMYDEKEFDPSYYPRGKLREC